MATKDQERKALEQIAEIINKVGGADSYIGKAFEGCIEMARDNIDNDFWNSWEEKYNSAMDKGIKDIAGLLHERDALKEKAEKAEERYNMMQKISNNWCAKYYKAANSATENWNKFREQENKAEALELEIIKLKARLFDLLDK